MGNVVPPLSSGTSLPEVLSSVLRPAPALRYRACGNRSEINPVSVPTSRWNWPG